MVDKFHVVRMANDALERVRKGLRKELKPSQSRTLKGDRKILLKRAHEVSDRERLIMETWTGAFPQLLAAYEHKERFYGIWDATTRLQAEAALDEWIATIPKGQKEVWSDLVRAVGKLARRDHDLLRDGHARHQRLHGVHQPTGQGQEP